MTNKNANTPQTLVNPRVTPNQQQAPNGTDTILQTPNETLLQTKNSASPNETILQSTTTAQDPKNTLLAQPQTQKPKTPAAVTELDHVTASTDIRQHVTQQDIHAQETIIKERFLLTKMLGAGGMGNVYLARDLLREEMGDDASLVAIKVLNEACQALPGALQALQREAKKAQQLSHPNIVTVYDFDRDHNTAFVSMEYIQGQELKDILATETALPLTIGQPYIQQMLSALAYAHQQNIVHADIKPANIFVSDKGIVKILDFGIAKVFNAAQNEQKHAADLLTEGALTPAYASPEALDGKPPSPADDVYSAACVAYELLSGQHPFTDAKGAVIAANTAKEQGLKVKRINGVPTRLMAAITKGLAFDARQRHATAAAFLTATTPRSRKKDALLITAIVIITGLIALQWQSHFTPPPTLEAINPEFTKVISSITDADTFYQLGDIDSAHRLYAYAWELAADEGLGTGKERDTVNAVISERVNAIIDTLIIHTHKSDASEYEIKEAYIALKFLAQDQIPGRESKIKKTLQKIERKYNFDAHAN